MKFYLGMAKSSLNWKPGQVRALEVDVLQLVLAKKLLRSEGHEVRGWIMVPTPRIIPRIKGWLTKWLEPDLMAVSGDLTEGELRTLKSEKSRNKEAISGRCLVGANASFGGSLMEGKLRDWIKNEVPGINEILDRGQFPFGVAWDFFGIIE